ncbi:glycosyltransferase [Hymenobacter taeanensis]|uniref:Glycosyltransferase n=1 Tax=Hymenobacter taeanensis TaxID=2735321 RepID=A0A6M6BCM8_9BACT|nr:MULTISPECIES: glycosyltransferase [Hymenobacter]QJX45568.1 glycosyltransferase [Hymenobacter taeanensis]UOQ81184.1 glycosyltransferase [Hymenobacter sp. 5414T-23]
MQVPLSSPEPIAPDALLVEVAWEVCNQVGGIYTVIRSKVPATVQVWDERYCLLGPYFAHQAQGEFEPYDDYQLATLTDPFADAVREMRRHGYDVQLGIWLVTGRPRVVLINPYQAYNRLGQIKYDLWHHHGIPTPDNDDLLHQVEAFGYLAKIFLQILTAQVVPPQRVLAHFHEWMTGVAIPDLRREQVPVHLVFTTHATLLGRYLAMNDPNFYDHLMQVDWAAEARHFNIETAVTIERAAAHGSHVFTTVSELTVRECIYLLDRIPDAVLPNGLNIERFVALHEFQNLHQQYKSKIHEFVMAHFFQSYSFDLDNTLYLFTSGRYEYHNKGFDLTLEALARLNYRLQQSGLQGNVVMFFITKRPFHSINPQVLQSRAVLDEVQATVEAIQQQVGERLFYAAAASTDHRLPDLSSMVDDYWKLRYRRTLQSWKTTSLPPVITHNLVDDANDDILDFVRRANLVNNQHDRVKIVYHPDFVSPTSPLFGMEYGQFVRGCHLGIFPSYYEPWGYTPLECAARGVPAITSDLSGFGDYVLQNVANHEDKGIFVVHRQEKSFEESAEELTEMLWQFVQLNRRERIMQRNNVESSSELFDWKNLRVYYDRAYALALERY